MSVTVYLLLRPFAERAALQEGEDASPRKLRRYALMYRRAAALVPLLDRDGWDVWFDGVNVAAEHPDVATGEEAERRLAAIGIDPAWVDVSDLSSLVGEMKSGGAPHGGDGA